MNYAGWQRIAWTYHILFAAGVTWPLQALVNTPRPYVLGLPFQMAWCAAWVVGSLIVMWRLDAARGRAESLAAADAGRPSWSPQPRVADGSSAPDRREDAE